MDTITKEKLQELYKVKEVAKILNVSEEYIYRNIRKGEISCIKLGKKYLITRYTIIELVKEKLVAN